MALEDELLAIERGFWLDGEDFFLANVDEKCLLVFPQMGQMVGSFTREQVAATAQPTNRWRDLGISGTHLAALDSDVALLSYRADVTRFDGMPYRALVSSAYVRRYGMWKLAFHQHSPLAAGDRAPG